MYLSEWRALAGRISGVVAAAQFNATIAGPDSFGRARAIRNHCAELVDAVGTFKERHGTSISADALACIDQAITKIRPLTDSSTFQTAAMTEEAAMTAAVHLSVFLSEMSFLLADVQAEIRSRAERAFEHLNRLISVDQATRSQWAAAFELGEPDCEKLGGVYLLLHGIWAFKVNATGGRTDLVYQEPVDDPDPNRRWADGLVLTEWKKAKSESEAPVKFRRALTQAKIYAAGILAGIELAGYRYLIVVSERPVAVPTDIRIGDVTFRHINIVVDPQAPSKEAAEAGKGTASIKSGR